jgi:hypothetical protein
MMNVLWLALAVAKAETADVRRAIERGLPR